MPPAVPSAPDLPPPDAVSVAEFTEHLKCLVEDSFSHVRVYGEVIGLTCARSGHVYFTLKDDSGSANAQVSVALWKQKAFRLRFALEDGMRVVVSGRVSVYEPRGSYQIIAESITPAGQGALLQAFEKLKRRLWAEGLFAPERKRPLPAYPRCVGLITSPSGAAIHDVLRSIRRKFPAWVRVFPVRVQGEGAAEDIVTALKLIGDYPQMVDVVILARGGGSLEDLWTFNEEKVARAVAGAAVPTISGVGHEVDTTLCDLAADVRAQTPTHAGEIVVPDIQVLGDAMEAARVRLMECLRRRVESLWQTLIQQGHALRIRSPGQQIERRDVELDALVGALKKSLYNRLREWEDQLSLEEEKLRALSPLNVLKRGFSVTLDHSGRIVRSAREVSVGDELVSVLAEGELAVRVVRKRDVQDSRSNFRTHGRDGSARTQNEGEITS